MTRPISMFTGQWADLPFEIMCNKAREIGLDALEICTWGDHLQIPKAIGDKTYCERKLATLKEYRLGVSAISTHLVGQCVCDRIDERHKSILPDYVWGNGDPEGVRKRAAEEVMRVADVAKMMGTNVVVGFTGSSVWHLLYAWPPTSQEMIQEGYKDFARRWKPIMDYYQSKGVKFALEVHPTEIAFDIPTAERTLKAIDNHPAFGFNFDPSHFGYQGVDYVAFIRRFGNRIFNCHIKDVTWSDVPKESGVFGGHLTFGDSRRYWDFRSPGRGKINFDAIIRALNEVGFKGALSIEWEDSCMDREFGAKEACSYIRQLDFPPSALAFDAQFDKK